jgi:hypothetical protein
MHSSLVRVRDDCRTCGFVTSQVFRLGARASLSLYSYSVQKGLTSYLASFREATTKQSHGAHAACSLNVLFSPSIFQSYLCIEQRARRQSLHDQNNGKYEVGCAHGLRHVQDGLYVLGASQASEAGENKAGSSPLYEESSTRVGLTCLLLERQLGLFFATWQIERAQSSLFQFIKLVVYFSPPDCIRWYSHPRSKPIDYMTRWTLPRCSTRDQRTCAMSVSARCSSTSQSTYGDCLGMSLMPKPFSDRFVTALRERLVAEL